MAQVTPTLAAVAGKASCDRPLAPPWQDDFEVPMAPGAVNVLDDILGEGEGLDFDATSPRIGAER